MSETVAHYCSVREAIISKKMDVLELLLQEGCEFGELIPTHKINPTMIRFLFEHNYPMDKLQIFLRIVSGGSIKDVEWALANKFPMNSQAFLEAAKHNNTELLDLLHSHNCPLDLVETSVATCAAYHGNLESLKWFVSHGCKLDPSVYDEAIWAENYDVLEYLESIGYKFTDNVFEVVAKIGETGLDDVVGMMNFLYQKGWRYDDYSMNIAIERLEFKLVKWLVEIGCPVSKSDFEFALRLDSNEYSNEYSRNIVNYLRNEVEIDFDSSNDSESESDAGFHSYIDSDPEYV